MSFCGPWSWDTWHTHLRWGTWESSPRMSMYDPISRFPGLLISPHHRMAVAWNLRTEKKTRKAVGASANTFKPCALSQTPNFKSFEALFLCSLKTSWSTSRLKSQCTVIWIDVVASPRCIHRFSVVPKLTNNLGWNSAGKTVNDFSWRAKSALPLHAPPPNVQLNVGLCSPQNWSWWSFSTAVWSWCFEHKLDPAGESFSTSNGVTVGKFSGTSWLCV